MPPTRVRMRAVSYDGPDLAEAVRLITDGQPATNGDLRRTRAELEQRIAELEQALRAVIPWASKGGWNGRVPPEVKRAKKVLGAAVRPPKGGG